MNTALGLLLLLSLAGSGDREGVPGSGSGDVQKDRPLEPTQVTQGITLEDCIRKAYFNNVSLKKSRQSLESVSTTIEGALGKFDPEFFTNVIGSENINPSFSYIPREDGSYYRTVSVTDVDNFSISTGFSGTLMSGATYTLDYNTGRTFYDFTGGRFPAEYDSDAGIQLRQPLLKNAWSTFTRAEYLRARLDTESQAQILETDLNDLVFSVIQAYWNLQFTIDDVEAKEKSLSLAKELLAINTRKKEEGVFSKMEVLEASVDVAVKKEELLTARNAVKEAEDQLKQLIYPFESPADWESGLVPLTKAEEAKSLDYDMEGLIQTSFEHRPEYQRLKTDLEQRELDVVTSRNQLRPQLDVTGQWRYNGLGNSWADTRQRMETADFRFFSVGMEFSYPLGNRSAEAAYRQARTEHQKAVTSLKEQEIQIVKEIRAAVRDTALQSERLNAIKVSLNLVQERYNGEIKRLEAGMSIPYLVREAERELLTETVKKARALLDYQIAVAKVAQVTGVLLEAYHIEVTPEDWENDMGE